MKLLILTQKVNIDDPILGFFHQWVIEFSKYFEVVTVICLEKGKYELPGNVRVLSLGKDRGISKLGYVLNFYKYVWNERENYDLVFVHMNHEYVVLGGLLWKILRKKVGLWYTHRQTSFKLWLAEKLVDVVFTSSKESFRLASKKINIMGHGIDPENFQCNGSERNSESNGKILTFLSIGRITEVKNCDVLIRAAAILKKNWGRKFSILFIGSPVNSSDLLYFQKLKDLVKELDVQSEVSFVGSFTNKEIAHFYCKSDLTVNLSPTGGTDKVVLESLVSRVPCVVSNEAFRDLFGMYAHDLIVRERNENDVAQKIIDYFARIDRPAVSEYLHGRVLAGYKLGDLIKKIVGILNEY